MGSMECLGGALRWVRVKPRLLTCNRDAMQYVLRHLREMMVQDLWVPMMSIPDCWDIKLDALKVWAAAAGFPAPDEMFVARPVGPEQRLYKGLVHYAMIGAGCDGDT